MRHRLHLDVDLENVMLALQEDLDLFMGPWQVDVEQLPWGDFLPAVGEEEMLMSDFSSCIP